MSEKGTFLRSDPFSFPDGLGSEYFTNSTAGDVTGHLNTRGFVTSYQYNLRRQPTVTTAPANVTVGIAYDAVGNVNATTNARTFVATQTWSSTRQLTSVLGPSTPQGSPLTTNLYDVRDWLARTVINPCNKPSSSPTTPPAG
jgi:YD repeat-containing protein